jgi:hypothetical protein
VEAAPDKRMFCGDQVTIIENTARLFCFKVTVEGTAMYFTAESEEEQEAWKSAFNSQ